jgi:hypothetical protein
MEKGRGVIVGIFFIIYFAIFFAFPVTAQNKIFTCGTDELLKKQLKENHALNSKHEYVESQILNHQLHRHQYKTSAVNDYIIPVVVHIMHNNGTENISDAQILTGLQHLNDAFNNIGIFNTPTGTYTGIQFCLARQDDNGNATSGITRTVTNLTDLTSPTQDLALKNLNRWDPNNYLNIWIVNEVTSLSSGPGVAGYAYFPSSHGTTVDGVVCEARYFGSSPDNSKVHIHELGHYLGLYHTFEGACTNNNCMVDGDKVCDTPPDASVSPTLCPVPVNTCITDSDDPSSNNPFRPASLGGTGDQSDMTSNYMDYGLDQCRIIFTPGQKERMVTSLTLIRKSLLNSKGCIDPCPNPINISFSPDDSSVVIGAVVNFINTTNGATTYQWKVDGTTFSNTANASYQFNQQGKHVVTLIASNSLSTCTKEKTIIIKVQCSIHAAFTGPLKVKPGEPISFTNTTPGTNTYQWFLGETSLATTTDLVHTFTSAGGFMISLVSFNGSCYDTVKTFIQAGDCNPGNQGNHWYFGNWTSVEFSGGTTSSIAIPITVPHIFLRSDEGCVSMSDASGNFLFFANPQYVFNRNLLQMPNGSGLMGDFSATQIATVQNITNPNKYYLFTLDAFGGPDGLRYSEVDMSLDGGLGDVVVATKNTLIVNSVTEKITTVKHANGTDTWIIVHEYNSNRFFSYLVSGAGINMTPVISNVGTVHVQDMYNQNSIGQLKASPDGCKLALAISGLNIIELFNFNNLTGGISSPTTFNSPDYSTAYGIEFSPDGSKLYVGIEFSRNIYQFNLNAGNSTSILNSRYLVTTVGTSGYLSSFQIGPYGKIYIGRNDGTSFLAVINNPNASGASCNFVSDGVSLAGRLSSGSLPSFNQSYFYDPTPTITGPDTVCANSKNISYHISGSTCSSSINLWSLKGKAIIVSSNDTIAKLDFKDAGIDTLIVERTAVCGKSYDTIRIHVINSPVLDLKDTVQCTSSTIVLNAGSGFTSYHWQDNSSSPTYSALSAGKYWVTVTNAYGCSVTDTVRVFNHLLPNVSLGSDSVLCNGTVSVLDAGSGYMNYDWQDHLTEQTYTVFIPGKYWVTVTDQCGSKASDTIRLSEAQSPALDLANVGICPDESILLDAGSGYKKYLWQNGQTSQSISVSSKGIYWIKVTDKVGCTASDTVIVFDKAHCCSIYIPNLVTLNNDGINDRFAIQCIELRSCSLDIYNRWGDLVYRSGEYKNDWPAENISDGVYYYLIKKEDKSYRGWVQIVQGR